jgi:hypothetical protein
MTDQTTSTGRPSEGGHWYTREGLPAYEIANKSNGGMRPVTLRDARKLGLLPGVSAIVRLEAQPGLQRWLIEQHVLAAMTLPRVGGESDEQFKARVFEDANAQSAKARERGTEIHTAIERGLRGEWIKPEDEPYARPVVEWVQAEFGAGKPELSFACREGYGGKADFVCEEALLDFKTKDFIDSTAPKLFEEHSTQLAAYRNGFALDCARCVNVFVSTKVPGLFVPLEHAEPALKTGLAAFRALLELWRVRRSYDPRW